jgi:hypothetical protein
MRVNIKLSNAKELDTYEEVKSVFLDEKCLTLETENGKWIVPAANIQRYFLFNEEEKAKSHRAGAPLIEDRFLEMATGIKRKKPETTNQKIQRLVYKEQEEKRIKEFRDRLDKMEVSSAAANAKEVIDKIQSLERQSRKSALESKFGKIEGQFQSDFKAPTPEDAVNVSGSDHEQKKAELESKLREAAKYQEIPFNTPEGIDNEVMEDIATRVRGEMKDEQAQEQQLQPQPPFIPKEQMDPSLPDEEVESEE